MTLNISKVVFSDLTNNKLETNRHITFKVKDIDLSLLNYIRVSVVEIPNISFEFKDKPDAEELKNPDVRSIQIKTNTHFLNNEFLSHRLSMIPLNFDMDEILTFKEYPRKYIFKLKRKNISDEIMEITTNDIEIYNDKNKKYPKDFHEKIFPKNHITNDYILITKLRPNRLNKLDGEEIDITMYPTLGTGKKHACYKFLSNFTVSYIVDELQANRKLKEHLDKYKKENPEATPKVLEEVKDDFNNLDRQRITYKNEYDEPNRFYITCESESRVDPRYLISRTIRLLDEKLDVNIKKLINEEIKIKYEGITDNGGKESHIHYLEIENESSIFGNVVQSLFVNYFIRENKGKRLNYCGFRKPHPLENYIALRVGMTNETSINEVKKTLIDGFEQIQDYLKHLNNKWLNFCKLPTTYSKDLSD